MGDSLFEASVYQPYRTVLLSPERVRQLSALRPLRAVADTFRSWAWIIAAWIVCALQPKAWVVALALPVIGCHYYALFILGHDAMHGRIFNSPRLNNLFADLFMFGPIGAITRINKWNHLEHHRLLGSGADPDRYKYCCFDKADFLPFAAYFTGVQSFYRSARNAFIRGPRFASGASGPARPGYAWRDICLLAGWQGGLLAGLTWAFGWWGYPLLWVFPGFTFAFLGDNLRTFAEHSQPAADRIADRHRLISYVSHPLERLFLAPLNMNYHATHHLWPSIPYYHLPQADREIRGQPGSEGLEWRTSYFGYLLRYALALPLEECKLRVAPAS